MMNNSGFSRRPLCALRYFEFAPRRPFALCTGGLLPVRLAWLARGFHSPDALRFRVPTVLSSYGTGI